ncbi:MAG: carbohydrate-binding family 9-like protein [Verrucomicrobia bacterium]|nr:carbohydrate-binding family 9-like protein [Verrucomicrobiota bacterium]
MKKNVSPQKSISARSSHFYTCRRVEGSIRMDGKLDEPSWRHADVLTAFVVAGKRKPAIFQTTVRLLWDDRFLYFGAEMEDADIYGLHEGHDAPFGGDDIIELFVKPDRRKPPYWEFHVTPRGATRDYFYARRGAGPNERWMVYDSGMRAAVSLDGTLNHWEDRDKGWTVEMTIPWIAFATCALACQSLGQPSSASQAAGGDRREMGGRPQPGDRWTFLASRYDYSVHLEEGLQLSASSILPKANYHLFEFYRDLVFAE